MQYCADVLRRRDDVADNIEHPRRDAVPVDDVFQIMVQAAATALVTGASSVGLRDHRTSADHRLANLPLHSARHQPFLLQGACVPKRAVPNILFVFYLVRIIGRIVYSYSAE